MEYRHVWLWGLIPRELLLKLKAACQTREAEKLKQPERKVLGSSRLIEKEI